MIWLLVNRDPRDDEVVELTLSGIEQGQWFDLYHGKEIVDANVVGGEATFSLEVEAGGYGAVMVTASGVDQDFQVYCLQNIAKQDPGRAVKQQQEQISAIQVQGFYTNEYLFTDIP